MRCTYLTVQRVEEHLNNFRASVTRKINSGITDHFKRSQVSTTKKVCDSISLNVSERFKYSGHLRKSQLF